MPAPVSAPFVRFVLGGVAAIASLLRFACRARLGASIKQSSPMCQRLGTMKRDDGQEGVTEKETVQTSARLTGGQSDRGASLPSDACIRAER